MGLLKRRSSASVTLDQMESQLARAVADLRMQLPAGVMLRDDVALGFAKVPNDRGGWATTTLALAAVTSRGLVFANAPDGRPVFDYPLGEFSGYSIKENGEWLAQFVTGVDQIRLCAWTPLIVSDLPPMMTATASNGVVIGLQHEWEQHTGRKFVNAL